MSGVNLPPTPPAWPVLGHTGKFVADPLGFIRRSVDSTGDVFRLRLLGKDIYILAHPDQFETALLNRDTFVKLDDFQVAFGDALLSVEGEQWQRQRHAMEGFFSPTQIPEYAETMAAVAENRIADWTTGGTIDIGAEMRAVALENLFELVLGHTLADDTVDDLSETAAALNLWFKPTSWALPEWVPTPARRQFEQGSAELRDRARTLLSDAGDTPAEESLLATLAALRADPESGFDQAEVLDQVVGMIFAGHETTALSMTYALHQISAHPAVAERFYAEIDDVLDGQPTYDDLQKLTYLDTVINEAFRLYPPVHAIPRMTTEQVDIGGYRLPADAEVLLSIWSLHRDPRFYTDPETFDPTRWEDQSARERGYEFVPFGSGPRICIGRHFARLEMKAVLAEIGRTYRLETQNDIELAPQMTTQPATPITMRVRDR